MKRIVSLSIIMFLSMTLARAQKTNSNQTNTTQKPVETEVKKEQPAGNPLGDHFASKYAIAARWNDFDVAKDAMYDLIVEYPGSDSLIFALSYFYYENQKYPSSVLVCQDLLARNPKNVQALELAGMDYESLNIYDRALQSYESLFLLTNNNLTLYKMSFLQYELKRYTECLTNVDILLANPDADIIKVGFNDTNKKPKEYAMRVALLNLKGMVYKAKTDNVNARKYFQEALAIAPDFLFARQNLDGLK